MTFAQGAAIPVVGKTTLESLRALNLKIDVQLFIAGASGAIGSLVIKLAVSEGKKYQPQLHKRIRLT